MDEPYTRDRDHREVTPTTGIRRPLGLERKNAMRAVLLRAFAVWFQGTRTLDRLKPPLAIGSSKYRVVEAHLG